MAFSVPDGRIMTGMWGTTDADGRNGRFFLRGSGKTRHLIATASDRGGWEHVSVVVHEFPYDTPTWAEMCRVKENFWDDEDVVVQYHPKASEYVNLHPGCLHLWRPANGEMPRPDPILVGFRKDERIGGSP